MRAGPKSGSSYGAFTTKSISVAENAGHVTLTVVRLGGSGDELHLACQVRHDGTADIDRDFIGPPGGMNWTEGDISPRTYTVTILDDQSYEGTEDFSVVLIDPLNGSAIVDTGRVYIIDDEKAGVLNFSPDSASVDEKAGSVKLSVARTDGSAGPASVHYDTLGGTALPENDFAGSSGDLQWADGDASSKTITVEIINDNIFEPNKTFYVVLNGASGAGMGSQVSATVTLLNDDRQAQPGTVQFEKGTYQVSEQANILDVNVTRTNGSSGEATVKYACYDQTAEAGRDYTAVSGSLHWYAGDAVTKTIEIPVMDDDARENKESFRVVLSNPTGAALGSPYYTAVFIEDDESDGLKVGFDTNRVLGLFGTMDPIRVVQVIDTDNRQLVAGAVAVVRVYLYSNVTDRDIPVLVELWCDSEDVGAEFGTAFRKGRFNVSSSYGVTHAIVANGHDSVNIVLGRGSRATAAGRRHFVARVLNSQTRELYVKRDLYVTFKPTASVCMVVVPINVLMTPINGSNTIAYAGLQRLANANEYLQYVYPVGANAVGRIITPALQWHGGRVVDHNDRLIINDIRLRALQFPEVARALQTYNNVYFVGAIADVADILGANCFGFTFGTDTSIAIANHLFSITAAHEIGHDRPFRLGDRYNSAMSEPHDSNGRYITLDIGAFSPVYKHPACSTLPGQPRINGYEARNVYGFMGAVGGYSWAERFEFNGIYPLLTAGQSLNSRADGKAATLSPTGAMAVAQGTLTTNNVATLLSLAPFASTNGMVRPESGMYYLSVLDSATQELDRAWFDVSWTLYNGAGMTNATLAPFAETIWLPAHGRAVNLCASNGTILAGMVRSASAPTVTLTGAIQDGPYVNLTWTGSDADGGGLTYSVYYSHDGGSTFDPILANVAGATSARIGMANQPGGNYCRFRVLASDGMNAGWADTGFMIFSNKAPVVAISSLSNGDYIAEGKTINLLGAAYDCEDGALTNSALVWLVNHGPAGMGEYANFIAATSGVYTVTLEARDSCGNAGRQSVTVTAGAGMVQTAGTILAADFDGDGKADPAVVACGQWYVWFSGAGYACGGPYDLSVANGSPVAGDLDGDRLADPAMAAGANWYVWFSSGGYRRQGPFDLGMAGMPLVADIDADGRADPIVVACGGDWYAWPSASGYAIAGPFNPLVCGDPLAGDFDGDRRTDIGIAAGGHLCLWLSGWNYSACGPFALADAGATAATGDLDGDSLSDVIMVNANNWYVWFSRFGFQCGGPYHLEPQLSP